MFRTRVCVNMCYIFLPPCSYMILSRPVPSQTVYSSISILPCNSPGRVRLFCPLSQSLYFHRHQLPTPFSLTQSWRGRKRKAEKEGGGEGGVWGRVVNSYHVWIWHLGSWQKEGGILSFIIYCYQLLTGLSGWEGGNLAFLTPTPHLGCGKLMLMAVPPSFQSLLTLIFRKCYN